MVQLFHFSKYVLVFFIGISGAFGNSQNCNMTEVLERIDQLEASLKAYIDAKAPPRAYIPFSKHIPKTDPECTFNLGSGVCEPVCDCALMPKIGDFTFNRMCRLIPVSERNESCNTNEVLPNLIQKASAATKTFANSIVTRVRDHAPYSDDVCAWSFQSFRCVPERYCSFDYQVGDYSLHRACRLRGSEYYDVDSDESDSDESDDSSSNNRQGVNGDHTDIPPLVEEDGTTGDASSSSSNSQDDEDDRWFEALRAARIAATAGTSASSDGSSTTPSTTDVSEEGTLHQEK